jgi:hypothetical protein
MSWEDREYQHSDEGGASFPFVQWQNDGAQLDPRNPRGGFVMPEDQMHSLGTYPADAEVCSLTFRNGESITAFFAEQMEVAVLTTRFCWIKDGDRVNTYVPGARSKLQALCLMRDAGSRLAGPMMLTFRGIPGKLFAEAYKKHRARVNKATKGGAPSYAFVMRIAAGEPEMVGSQQQSRITPVLLVDDFDPDVSYVGDGTLDAIDNERFWNEVKAWRKAWAIPGPNGDGEVEGSENETDAGRSAAQDIGELFGDGKPKGSTPSSPQDSTLSPSTALGMHLPKDDPQALARAVNVKLPPTQKYGVSATVGDLERANDVNALQWFVANASKHPEVAHASSVVLEAIRRRNLEEQEIPFVRPERDDIPF